jgi:hypothetical protein
MGGSESCLNAESPKFHGEQLAGKRGSGKKGLPRKIARKLKDSHREERSIMNKDRLEWVMSGLSQYALTDAEDLFLKSASADFDKNQALTERQEERLENLYKEKSRLLPSKKIDRFSVSKSTPKKTRPLMHRGKVF